MDPIPLSDLVFNFSDDGDRFGLPSIVRASDGEMLPLITVPFLVERAPDVSDEGIWSAWQLELATIAVSDMCTWKGESVASNRAGVIEFLRHTLKIDGSFPARYYLGTLISLLIERAEPCGSPRDPEITEARLRKILSGEQVPDLINSNKDASN